MTFAARAIRARQSALTATARAQSPHVGSALSCIDILVFLFEKLTISQENSRKINKLVFSKGHAAIALYSVLEAYGLISKQELESYCIDGSQFYGHVNQLAHPLVELSTGSLGHGLPFAVGLAHAKKLRNETGLIFVVMSDGELDEGTTWESALLASKFALDNLVCIVDRNHLQSLSSTESTLPLEPLKEKWEAFGWEVKEANGHDFESLSCIDQPMHQPRIVLAKTIKGKGVKWMENDILWHYRWPSESQLLEALSEIENGGV